MSLADRFNKLEKELDTLKKDKETKKKTKQFKWPFKWRWKFNKSTKRVDDGSMLVIFLNKKNEIEPPRFMPIFSGNMIVWKNKPYEFDPRAIWRIKGVKKQPSVYLIKEIDRRPVKNPDGSHKVIKVGNKEHIVYSSDAAISNMDVGEVRMRGDSTESDEFLIKAALKAQTSQVSRKQVSIAVIIIIILLAIGGLVYFLGGG
jgi:hypothetical protein